MKYYGNAVIRQLAFAYLFHKALSVLAVLQETYRSQLVPRGLTLQAWGAAGSHGTALLNQSLSLFFEPE